MGKSGVCLRERCPEEEWLFRNEEVNTWSPFEQRADFWSAQSKKNMENQLTKRCLHILYTKYRMFYIGSKRNELGLLLMRMYSEGDMDYLKLKTY